MPPAPGSWRRAVGTALAVIGVALGVTLIVASLAVAGGVERSIQRTVGATLGRADFRVSAPPGGALSAETLVTIQSVLGVAVAAPEIDQEATLLAEPGLATGPSAPVTLLGVDPMLDGQVHDLELVAGGLLSRRDEAAAIITERLAADDGYGVGSDVIVATPGEPERFRVIGVVVGDGPLEASGGRTVILPIETVFRMFGLEEVARVDLLVEDEIPLDGVRAELDEVLAGQPHVVASPADVAAALRAATPGLAAIGGGLGAMGLLVGAFIVVAAVRGTAADRGAASRPVRDIAAIGAVGSALGLLGGTLLAGLTSGDVGPAGVGLGGVAAAIAVAMLVAVAATAWPSERLVRRLPDGIGRLPGGFGRIVSGAPAIGLGLLGLLAGMAATGQRVPAEPSSGPVVGRVVAQLDALALLALVGAGAWVVGLLLVQSRWTRRGA